MDSAQKYFQTLETARLPARLPAFASLYHSALFQAD
jgi:hypothetical protein